MPSKLGLSEISISLVLLYAWSMLYIHATKIDQHTTKATLASFITVYHIHSENLSD